MHDINDIFFFGFIRFDWFVCLKVRILSRRKIVERSLDCWKTTHPSSPPIFVDEKLLWQNIFRNLWRLRRVDIGGDGRSLDLGSVLTRNPRDDFWPKFSRAGSKNDSNLQIASRRLLRQASSRYFFIKLSSLVLPKERSRSCSLLFRNDIFLLSEW